MSMAVELILSRNLSEHLSTPFLLLDAKGDLAFFNEAAEVLVGKPYEDLGEMGSDWPALLHPVDDQGREIEPTLVPALIAVRERSPGGHRLRLRMRDGANRELVAYALPLFASDHEYLGSIVTFWPA
jgi:PAS domain-containing protein